MAKSENLIAYAAGFAVLAAIIYVAMRGAGGVAQDVSRTAVNVAGGAVTGTVKGVSDTVGIPDTDAAKCQAALAAGDSWNASFYCPAGTFIKSIFTGGGDTKAANQWPTLN